MDAKITGEGDDIIGLSVIDNNGVEHLLEIDKSGEITGYQQEGYPDSGLRTDEDEIYIEQAQYYARYYVQRERGYPTFYPYLTPEWLAHTLGAVFALDFDAFAECFGEYAHQYHSSLRPNIDPIVELPETDGPIGGIIYRADVFLRLDFQDYLDNPEAMDPLDHVEGITDDYDLVTALREMVTEHLDNGTNPIKEVSAVDVLYQTKDSRGTIEEKTVGERSHTQDRPADAQLQMTPPQTTLEQDLSTEIIQGLVLHHLTCQVRDAYLRLGIDPPEPFRILGQGLYEQTIRYQHTDLYDPYHLTDAEIEGYRQPGFDTGGIESGSLMGSSQAKTLSGLIKRALFGG
ncbi:hypothetical protein C453_00470 [Haloferax elongans ATCC BAA-1513]|uniref:Uncharacterized protein n=1 Tax=Haloferax elongans ATCC BAA-1513 TaxID=1230453 RepID=M0I2A5_HALEO|nr:hypothetical protein [Haloferax elongans]ELZ89504.1 hypothetical protein C453_00470 [Haloferax elongans ATCC BAA-1513]